jgi:hypothetical protein
MKWILAMALVGVGLIIWSKLPSSSVEHAVAGAVANWSQSWTYEEPTDKLTGHTYYRAVRTVPLDSGGKAEMLAACNLKHEPVIGPYREFSIHMLFTDKKGQPLLIDQAGIDDGELKLRYSESQGKAIRKPAQLRHTSEIMIVYRNTTLFDDDNEEETESFANAPFAKIEIPLLDEDNPIIDLEPHDPALRKVFDQCFNGAVGQ